MSRIGRTFTHTETVTLTPDEMLARAAKYDEAAQTARLASLAAYRAGDEEAGCAAIRRWGNAAHFARKYNERARKALIAAGRDPALASVNLGRTLV